jgi:hypothetical protein
MTAISTSSTPAMHAALSASSPRCRQGARITARRCDSHCFEPRALTVITDAAEHDHRNALISSALQYSRTLHAMPLNDDFRFVREQIGERCDKATLIRRRSVLRVTTHRPTIATTQRRDAAPDVTRKAARKYAAGTRATCQLCNVSVIVPQLRPSG